MISMILIMHYHQRKRVILHLMMLMMIIAVWMVVINASSDDIQSIELTRLSLEMMSLLMPFMVLFIALDHHAPDLRPLDAFFGRSAMFFAKWLTSVIVFTYAWMMILLIQRTMLTLLTGEIPSVLECHGFMMMHLDGILLITIIPMIFKDKQKTLSILIPVAWIVLSMVLSDINHRWIHDLFPIGIRNDEISYLAYPYKLCYSVLVMIFAHQKSVWETI